MAPPELKCGSCVIIIHVVHGLHVHAILMYSDERIELPALRVSSRSERGSVYTPGVRGGANLGLRAN